MKEFMESAEGVHLMMGEFTLCGDSFDIGETEADPESALIDTKKKVVTCPRCISVIRHVRGVKIRE
jgi:hypothetical protein